MVINALVAFNYWGVPADILRRYGVSISEVLSVLKKFHFCCYCDQEEEESHYILKFTWYMHYNMSWLMTFVMHISM